MTVTLFNDTPLSELHPGDSGEITRLEASGEMHYAFLERGLGPGEIVRVIRVAPFGDPMEVELLDYRLALRKKDAEKIILNNVKITRKRPRS